MMMMTQFLPITTVTEIHTFILGSEFKYGAQVRIHVLGFTNSTGILLKCDAYTCHKYETTGKTNTTLPQIWWYSVLELKLKSRWKEIWNQAETNPIQRFPKFDGLSQPPSTLCGRFQTLCEEKNTQKPIQKWIQMHGRANLSRNATFKHLSLIWGPLKILHHGGRGCGSRLSICQLNIYNKYWDGNAV